MGVFRLYYTFHNSAYGISEGLFRFFLGVSVINPLLMIALIVSLVETPTADDSYYVPGFIAIALTFKLDFGVFVMTYKFCMNLYRLVLSQQHSNLSGQQSSLDKKQI